VRACAVIRERGPNVKTLRKYAGLYAAFFRASFISELEYRANFLTRILTDIIWYIAQIFAFEVIYSHTDRIGDWNLAQTRVFLGMLFVIDAIYMVVISENLDRFSEKIRKGDLDMMLAKPVSSQFLVSLQRSSTALLGSLLIAVGWLGYSLYRLPDFSPWRLLWLIIMIPSALVVLYCSRFFMASIAVIVTKSESLQFMWYQIYKLGMRPDSIYVPWLKFILMTVLPVAIVASVPARTLLDPPDLVVFLWAPALAVILLTASHYYWRYCLQFYSSASS